MDKTDVIKIEIPNDVIGKLRIADEVPESVKLQISRQMREGKLKIQQKKDEKRVIKDADNKCAMLFDVMKDRGDTPTSIDDILEVAEVESKRLGSFMAKLNKYARERGGLIKKLKRGGKTCYKMISSS